MTRSVHIDIETRSEADLVKVGVYAYAEHASTEITMIAYAVGNGEPAIWYPPLSTRPGQPIPADLAAIMVDPEVELVAHNAGFERTLLNGEPGQRLGVPYTDRERWECTAARAALMGLPRSLSGALGALDLEVQKDAEGAKLMRTMMKPHRATKKDPRYWIDDDETLYRVGDYCKQDVRGEQAIDAKLPRMRADERATWLLTEEMNDRGVLVDTELLTAVMMMVDEAEAAVLTEVRRRTDCICGAGATTPKLECGAVHGMHHSYITKWLLALGLDDLISTKDGGYSVAKATVAALLERDDLLAATPELDALVRGVLVLRQENGGTASKKYAAMLKRMSADNRIRGALVYCGAASTARWSSRGVQLQNLLRMRLLAKLARLQQAIRDVVAGASAAMVHELYGPPLVIAGELLRPTLVASPGHHMVRGDSSQIEARVLPWLSGATWKLDKFRAYDAGTGPDLYIVAATGIYRVAEGTITASDPRRQIGKVSELALGFQGGARALQSMARNYGMKIPVSPKLEMGEPAIEGTDEWIKGMWRAANPEIVQFWAILNTAAIGCMRAAAGPWFEISEGLAFRRNSEVLMMRLPSGRGIYYWSPRLAQKETPWGEVRDTVIYRSEDSVTHQWREFAGYGGLFAENATQTVARDLMAHWLRLCRAEGLRPILTVHDESVCEADARRYPLTDDAVRVMAQIMRTLPGWAGGLPVNAEASAGPRYVKT